MFSHSSLHSLCARDGWLCAYCGVELICRLCDVGVGAGPDVLVVDPRFAGWGSRKGDGVRWATRDHIIPRSRGGADAAVNLVAACGRCNELKSNSVGGVWALEGRPGAAVLEGVIEARLGKLKSGVPGTVLARSSVAARARGEGEVFCRWEKYGTQEVARVAAGLLDWGVGVRVVEWQCWCGWWHIRGIRAGVGA